VVLPAVVKAPIGDDLRTQVGARMLAIYKDSPESKRPDFDPAFAAVRGTASPADRVKLDALHAEVDRVVERAATHAFHRPLRISALFAILVLPVLGLQALLRRRRSP
jgi:hypothetical protein